jgi:hypothetical protein
MPVILAEFSQLWKTPQAVFPIFVVLLPLCLHDLLMSLELPEDLQELPGVTKNICPATQHFLYKVFFYPIDTLPSSQKPTTKRYICRLSHIFHFLFRKLFNTNVTQHYSLHMLTFNCGFYFLQNCFCHIRYKSTLLGFQNVLSKNNNNKSEKFSRIKDFMRK